MVFGEKKLSHRPQWDVDGLGALQEVPELSFFKTRPKTMSSIQCDYRDTTKGHLKEHVESIHEDVSYPCGQCDCRVTTKGNLKEHVRTIQEGVSYPCDQYDYSTLSL